MPSDVVAPSLLSLSVTDVVYLGNDRPWITIAAQATDDLSGVNTVTLWFNQNISYSYTYSNLQPSYSSTYLIGLYDFLDDWSDGSNVRSVAVNPFSAAGTRTVTRVTVEDQAGNVRTYQGDELAALGFDGTIEFVDARHEEEVLSGTDADDFLEGRAGNDTLYGFGGDDNLDGGPDDDDLEGGLGNDYLDGGSGDDVLVGGAGNDVYIIDSVHDVIQEQAGEGIDHVWSSVDLILPDNVEYFDVTQPISVFAIGNALSNRMIGDNGNDTLAGEQGDDTLVGGEDDDRLEGGDGADWLYGNWGEDVLNGGSGDDILVGDAIGDNDLAVYDGHNRLDGGAGNDTYRVSSSNDQVIEEVDGGTDRIEALISVTLAENVENLVLMGSAAINGVGNDLGNEMVGNGAANMLSGGAGNDTISGGGGDDELDGGTGSNRLVGGAGNDVYWVSSAADQIIEAAGGGGDYVGSLVSFTLAANVEDLQLMGMAAIDGTGNELANHMTGNDAANVLTGSGGNDTIYGWAGNDTLDGGSGSNRLDGGAGNDTYRVSSNSDRITEAVGGGTDRVEASISIALAANLEALVLTGTAAIDGTGNELANGMTGNAAANRLSGGAGNDTLSGGAGNDVLAGGTGTNRLDGGAGDDIYQISSTTDRVVEAAGGGRDRVESSVSVTLAANVETLALTGRAAIDGTGNDGANSVSGNAAANHLSGGAGDDTISGGSGTDILEGGSGTNLLDGGSGDDVYKVSSATDRVVEAAGNGIERVDASVSFTLAANIEHLIMTGMAAVDGTGNELANSMTGNAAANILSGGAGDDCLNGSGGNDQLKGGSGADILTGGSGRDVLLFRTLAESGVAASDTITDFSKGDRIDLAQIDANSRLSGNQAFVFLDGATPASKAGAVYYTSKTGVIWGDVNGDNMADFRIKVGHNLDLDTADFLL